MEPVTYMNRIFEKLNTKVTHIPVRDESRAFVMDEDGDFVCPHDNAMVDPPCCSGQDCACEGLSAVYCPDCEEPLKSKEIQKILERVGYGENY